MNSPTPAQLKLAQALLDIASEKFSRRSCNDYDLMLNAGLTKEEAREIQVLVNEWMQPEEAIDTESTHGDDWVFMHVVGKALTK